MQVINGLDYTGHNLVFVVGCPRSGTTWFQRLLATHPRVKTGQESHIFEKNIGFPLSEFRKLADPKKNIGGVGLACYFKEEEFVGIMKSHLMTLLQPMIGSLKPDEIFLEKTPTHVLFVPEIVELLPQSRIINIIRDPRDVAASLIAASRSWGDRWAPNNVKDAAKLWEECVTAARHAAQSLPSWQFLEVKYEDLHKSPGSVLKQCSDFLGLPWAEKDIVKAIEANQPTVAVKTGAGTAIPLGGEAARHSGGIVPHTPGFIRKAEVGSWRTDLSLGERFWLWRHFRHKMTQAGYDWPTFARVSWRLLHGESFR